MARRQRRTFSSEFKQRAVELARGSDKSLTQICAELDISETALRRWIFQAESADHTHEATAQLTQEEADELRRLRHENRVLREERDILKKAAAFFANEDTQR
jgi:transposase